MRISSSVWGAAVSVLLLTGCATTKIKVPFDSTNPKGVSVSAEGHLADFKLTSSGSPFWGMRFQQGQAKEQYLIPQISPITKASPEVLKDYNDGTGNVVLMSLVSSLGGISVGAGAGLGVVTRKWDASQYVAVGGLVLGGVALLVTSGIFDRAAADDYHSAVDGYNKRLDELEQQ